MPERKAFTVTEVLSVVKTQLESIPVSGSHVQTMAAAMKNIDTLLRAFEALRPSDGGEDHGETENIEEVDTDGGTV